jgi:hypothetical protein
MSIYFEGNSWQPAWFPIAPKSGNAAPGQPVTAVWRPNANHLDLFMTGQKGQVMSTFWDPDFPPPPGCPAGLVCWQNWFSIGPAGNAAPGQPISAVWSQAKANHLDLFMTGQNGQVMSTFWDPDFPPPPGCPAGLVCWQNWFPIGPAGNAAPGQPITVVWRPNTNHLDLFMTGRGGRVMSTFWEPNLRWQAWFPIDPETGRATPGQQITAVWRLGKALTPALALPADHLDLFMTGQDGRVMSTYFEGISWQSSWFAI